MNCTEAVVGVLLGRLGLEVARIPHADRHGLVWLSMGELCVQDGCLRFKTGGFDGFPAGSYALPHQTVSTVLLGPGSSVTHDALRIMARHGTCMLAVGEGGVRTYSAPPLRPDISALARAQVRLWSDPNTRIDVARRMYAWRFGEILPHKDLDVLRGMEGARLRRLYVTLAESHGLEWRGRKFDRSNPEANDDMNMALNCVAMAFYAAAAIAVYSVGTIPQLGFIHEDSGNALCLDIADLFRTSDILPVAFAALKASEKDDNRNLERHCRRLAGARLKKDGLIGRMIDHLKELFDVDDSRGDP